MVRDRKPLLRGPTGEESRVCNDRIQSVVLPCRQEESLDNGDTRENRDRFERHLARMRFQFRGWVIHSAIPRVGPPNRTIRTLSGRQCTRRSQRMKRSVVFWCFQNVANAALSFVIRGSVEQERSGNLTENGCQGISMMYEVVGNLRLSRTPL